MKKGTRSCIVGRTFPKPKIEKKAVKSVEKKETVKDAADDKTSDKKTTGRNKPCVGCRGI